LHKKCLARKALPLFVSEIAENRSIFNAQFDWLKVKFRRF